MDALKSFSNLWEIVDKHKNGKKREKEKIFETYISPAYMDIKLIYVDLMDILSRVEENIINDIIDVEEGVSIFKGKRSLYQPLREELRSKSSVIFSNTQKNDDLKMFAVGIYGILSGGEGGTEWIHNEIIIDNYLNDGKLSGEIRLIKGGHTLIDLIKRFDNAYSPKRINGVLRYNSRQKIKSDFIFSIQQQKRSMEKYWKLITFSYEKQKYKTYIEDQHCLSGK